MKTLILTLVMIATFALVGCSNKDSDVQTFISAADKLAGDIVQKVKANPTAAGLDEAQKLLDSSKSDIKAKYDAIKVLRGAQVSEEMTKKLTESTTKNIEAVNGLAITYAEQTVTDEAFGKKINKLMTDFNGLYGV